MRIFLIVSLLVLNTAHAEPYGTGDSYGTPDGREDTTQTPKGGTGLERKGLLDSMDISDKTKLDDREKCNTKCEMTFVQCYRIQTDRGKCYSTQQECLGKCGGGEAGGSDYGSPPPQSGGVLEF